MTPEQRQEWLEWRRGGITATDVAGIIGLSPWASPWSIWADKAGLGNDVEVTDAMEFGTRAEDMIADWFQDRTGLYVLGEQTWCSNPSEPWMRATVDGFVAESPNSGITDAIGGLEIKTTTDMPEQWDAQIPLHIACQVQWQMAVTGMPRTYLACLHLGFRVKFEPRIIERDEDDIALLVKTARAFWYDQCLTGVPPETDGSTATTEALVDAWDADPDATVDADLTVLADLAYLADVKARIKVLETEQAERENAIKARMGEATALVDGFDDKGRPNVLATWKAQDRTTIDTTALKAEMPDVAAKFTKSTQSRVFRLKASKGTS